ncbi:hypothetical protein ILUMI_20179 [Ignelater luminosus]|uniref:Single domain-containing protein n=1 Tax=Ignelater luminosus TaxID=2038154 RepID=A0A8K0CGU8_IGNLU|nr:hypothetical protein ILUMI_20179 [Ignelater luminosus]
MYKLVRLQRQTTKHLKVSVSLQSYFNIMYKSLVLVVAIIATVSCIPTINQEEAIDKPGYCRIRNVYIKEGEQGPGPIGECSSNTCVSAKPGAEVISSVPCPLFRPRKGCYRSEHDYTKQFPDCCPKEVCPDETEN